MKRREFITLIGGAAAAWPLAAGGSSPRCRWSGFLHPSSPEPFGHIVNGFRRGLSDAGFVEGQNVAIEYRFADPRPTLPAVREAILELIARPPPQRKQRE